MRRSRPATPGRLVAVCMAVLLGGLVVATATRSDANSVTALSVRLSEDGPTVADMVNTVARHARGSSPHPTTLEVVVVDELPPHLARGRPMLGGLQLGTTAWVRTSGGWPERTLLHEVAHAFAPASQHDDPWRRIYLDSLDEVFGPHAAAREAHRIAWVHDRCYRDRSCPGHR